jgi:hypothetical protein
MGEAWTYITPDAKKAKKMSKKDVFVSSHSRPPAHVSRSPYDIHTTIIDI